MDLCGIDMKALTLYQPWASLIADGRKTVETRSWSTQYRGELAIHAGATVNVDACKLFGYDSTQIPRGAIVCIVDLVDCVQFPSQLVKPDPYGDYTPGRFGWLLASIRTFRQPIPVKGVMGLWNWETPMQMRLF